MVKIRDQVVLDLGEDNLKQDVAQRNYPESLLSSSTRVQYPCEQFPREVYDAILDEVLSGDDNTLIPDLDTLRSCTLVSSGWTSRSQAHLFHTILLTCIEDIHALASLLDEKPSLGPAIERLIICVEYRDNIDGTYGLRFANPQSAAALFPTLLHGRLPRLCYLKIEVMGMTTRLHHEDEQPAREIHLPLPPSFQMHLAQFSRLSTLHLEDLVLRSFADLVRMLRALANVQILKLVDVHWQGLGTFPPRVFHVAAHQSSSGHGGTKDRILSHLEQLTLISTPIDIGVRLMISALGASMVRLCLNLPGLLPTVRRDAHTLDLSHLPNLTEITFLLHPSAYLHTAEHAISGIHDFLHHTLLRWAWNQGSSHSTSASAHPGRLSWRKDIHFVPHAQSGFCTRERYLNVLGSIGAVLEHAFFDESESPMEFDTDADPRLVIGVLITQLDCAPSRREWWLAQVVDRFPLFAQVDGIEVHFVDVPDYCHWVSDEDSDLEHDSSEGSDERSGDEGSDGSTSSSGGSSDATGSDNEEI
ncbi:hypothetical protein C8Q80DRAFT_1263477 [Daedaleopsis nitida]|nr:hypothetical protein C8Q80DRAFT_1263477 [Daedaleopsis nitida]